VGVRTELGAGDLRPLYLGWLAAYGTWERDEEAFDYDEENDLEPPVPAGLGALTAPQRALTGFLRLDSDPLTIAAQASPPLAGIKDDPAKLTRWIKDLPVSEKDKFLHRVAQGHGTQVQMELQRRFREPITCHHRKVQLRDALASLSRLQPMQLDATRSRRLPLVVGWLAPVWHLSGLVARGVRHQASRKAVSMRVLAIV
jgi:hypothetical protein